MDEGIPDLEAVPRCHASFYLAWMEENFDQAMSENVKDDVDEDSNPREP